MRGNSKSKKFTVFSLPKRKKPYRKSIHIYKEILDKTLPGEMNKILSLTKIKKFENNILLTQTERLTMNGRPKIPKYARNKNVLVVGESGSGKTRFFVLDVL